MAVLIFPHLQFIQKSISPNIGQKNFLTISNLLQKAERVENLVDDIRYGLYIEPDYKEEGINFIRALNLIDFWISGEILKIDNEKVPPLYKLKKGDVLIVRSGANTGCVGIIYPRLENSTFGSYTIRLRFNKINPFFVAIFLNTKYGLPQTKRLQTGMAQPNLNVPNIKDIKIPIVSDKKQKEIEGLCLEIEDIRSKSEILYHQAENLLLEELGLKDFKVDDSLSNVVNLSDVQSAGRMDAEYFQKKYEKLVKKLKNSKVSFLGDLVNMKKGIETGSGEYLEEDKQFIRVSSISKFGINENAPKYLSEELYKELKADFEPQKGEILLTKDATPGIACVVKEDVEGIISGGILRLSLETKEVEDEYLSLCLNSIVGEWQAERDAGGSIIKHWKPEQIKNVIIPILPKKIQQKISSLVRESFEARKKAKGLLEEAKNKVENLIENKS